MSAVRKLWSIGALTAACVSAFVAIRSLPAEACPLFHYGDYVTEAGAIEGCGFEESFFWDLTTVRYPVVATVLHQSLDDDSTCTALLELKTTRGAPLGPEALAISHTERLHALLVSEDLSDYQHLHPQPAGTPGQYRFAWEPRTPGTYHLYLDFISLDSGRRVVTEVQGLATPATPRPAREHLARLPRTDAIHLDLPEALQAGQEGRLRLTLDPQAGTFSTVMGAYAHLVAFAPQRSGFAHLHPTGLAEVSAPAAPPEALDFVLRVDHPGAYVIWAQVRLDGQDLLVPFAVEVEA